MRAGVSMDAVFHKWTMFEGKIRSVMLRQGERPRTRTTVRTRPHACAPPYGAWHAAQRLNRSPHASLDGKRFASRSSMIPGKGGRKVALSPSKRAARR